jgi:hypothetical protein
VLILCVTAQVWISTLEQLVDEYELLDQELTETTQLLEERNWMLLDLQSQNAVSKALLPQNGICPCSSLIYTHLSIGLGRQACL